MWVDYYSRQEHEATTDKSYRLASGGLTVESRIVLGGSDLYGNVDVELARDSHLPSRLGSQSAAIRRCTTTK
jgi:hypothetical protein